MSTGEVKVLDSRFSGCIMIGNPFEIHEIHNLWLVFMAIFGNSIQGFHDWIQWNAEA